MSTDVLNGKATLPMADITGKKIRTTPNGVFFIESSTLTVKSDNTVSVVYYVVGGGGGGGKGSSGTVGRGGGCGAVGYGILNLTAGTYTITVGAGGTGSTGAANSGGTNGGDTTFVKDTLAITAPGGKVDGTESSVASQTGISSSSIGSFTSNNGDAAPASGSAFVGKGGVDLFVGANIPASGGTAESLNGENGITIGSGGGGGYGAGNGGSGKSGAVILLLSSNDNLVNQIEYNLREMNQLPGTKIEQYNQQFSATMMAGAMWTVLATSLLFYVFTQV